VFSHHQWKRFLAQKWTGGIDAYWQGVKWSTTTGRELEIVSVDALKRRPNEKRQNRFASLRTDNSQILTFSCNITHPPSSQLPSDRPKHSKLERLKILS